MFDDEVLKAVDIMAERLGVEAAALLAIAEVESGGQAFATVGGRPEPLIRFEGHYFDQRLTGALLFLVCPRERGLGHRHSIDSKATRRCIAFVARHLWAIPEYHSSCLYG